MNKIGLFLNLGLQHPARFRVQAVQHNQAHRTDESDFDVYRGSGRTTSALVDALIDALDGRPTTYVVAKSAERDLLRRQLERWLGLLLARKDDCMPVWLRLLHAQGVDLDIFDYDEFYELLRDRATQMLARSIIYDHNLPWGD